MKLAEAHSAWLAQEVNFGGEMMTRAAVYRWFADQGYPQRAAELWLIGDARSTIGQ